MNHDRQFDAHDLAEADLAMQDLGYSAGTALGNLVIQQFPNGWHSEDIERGILDAVTTGIESSAAAYAAAGVPGYIVDTYREAARLGARNRFHQHAESLV